jgi:acyl dehydratase
MARSAVFESASMPAATPRKYAFEDFTVGRQMEFGAYRVKREDILRFAAEFDPQPFHLDE